MERNLVLIVDDENDICAELSISLSKYGYNVVVANNVHDAISLFRSRKPALVLTDYLMPGENGIDLLRKIKSIDRNINVILMSGVADVKTAALAMKEEAFDFLPKPIDLIELHGIIKNAIERTLQYAALKNQKRAMYLITKHDVNREQQASILYFNVNLDEFSSEKYKEEIVNLLNERTLNTNVIVDLKYVMYINNIGLNLLIYLADTFNERGLKFYLCNLTHNVKNYITTLGYEKYLNVEVTQEDALGKLN